MSEYRELATIELVRFTVSWGATVQIVGVRDNSVQYYVKGCKTVNEAFEKALAYCKENHITINEFPEVGQ